MTELAKRILIVRPDAIGTEAARSYDQAGWDVLLLPDLDSARSRCEERFDLALVSATLPDGDGLELIARLAGVSTWLWPEGEDSLRLLAAGAAGLIEEGLPHLESPEDEPPLKEDVSDLVLGGDSPAIERLRGQISKLARRDEPVLVMGETGVGKERVVRSLHGTSARANGPFVVVSAGALPGELVEAELFGHEEGAFTDAKERRIGRIEEADGGTLFLDGVSDLELRHQASLLRVLERGEVRPIGGRNKQVDVRIIASSREDLEQAVAAGRFRADLYHRIAVHLLYIPPLRERLEDLPMVLSVMAPALAEEKGLVELLAGERWPGNLRQLRNFLQRLELLQEPDESLVDLAARELAHRRRERSANRDWLKLPLEELVRMRLESAMPVDRPLPEAIHEAVLAEVERALFGLVMERVGGKQIRAAKHLGINRNTLRKKLKNLGLM